MSPRLIKQKGRFFNVITLYNTYEKPNFDIAYNELFSKAFADLEAKGLLSDAEKALGTFTSLDQYFAHMAELISINPNYTMLPLDEAPFEIDANSRTISVPKVFANCAGVKSDNMCEIATFTVDRFFDYVDLDTTSIVIQWVNAGHEEGISHVALKDLETYKGKIRFGWPLTDVITKFPGKVQFAVRFYMTDEKTKAVKYILNTMVAEIIIKDGLDIEAPIHTEENVSDVFKSFVKNSINPSYPTPQPVFFVQPGIDLPVRAALGEDDTLTLRAQAVASDNGAINYKWYYNSSVDDDDTAIELVSDDVYTIGESFERALDEAGEAITKRDGAQKYYTKNDDGASYSLYTDADIPEGTELYTRITTMKINADTDASDEVITGKYWVEATNTVGIVSDGALKGNSTTVKSTECNVPAPAPLVINENGDLDETLFLDKDSGTGTLSFAVNHDDAIPSYTYTWYKSETHPSEFTDLTSIVQTNGPKTENTDTCAVNAPGWYAVKVLSSLNRTKKTAKSKICKVMNHPAIPTILTMMQSNESQSTVAVDVSQEGVEYPDYANGDIAKLSITTDLDSATELQSDGLTYDWYVIEVDKGTRLLTEADIGKNGLIKEDTKLGKSSLTVRCINDDNANPTHYKCVVTNTLNGEKASTDLDSAKTFNIG